jgi:hypoxanthine phosphoribosyltransferase
MITHIRGKLIKELFSEDAVRLKVKELAEEIKRDYDGKNPILVGVLKGAFVFLSDLIRYIDIPLEVDFIWVSTYKSAMKPGNVEIIHDVKIPLKDRHVLLVEDILDTGVTLGAVRKLILDKEPASYKICALLNKKHRRKLDIEPDYKGFEFEEGLFVVGYGIDFAEQGRNLRGVYYVSE